MATPTATTVVLPPQEPAPAPAAPTGPLAAILDPVRPARPVQPIGSTATLAEESAGPVPADKAAKASARGGQQDGPFGALVRAIAARIGRPGSATTTKRTHTITEQRATGNQHLNRAQRNSTNTHASQHQNTRDAKLADLRNKADQNQSRANRDARSTSTRGATQARTSRDGRDVKDSRGAQTTDTTTAKKDDTTKTGTDTRDTKTTGGSTTQKPATAKDTTAPKDPAGKPAADSTKPDGQRPADKVNLDKTQPAPTTTPRPRTQSSREAGYRDGTRAGAIVNHTRAYRDGVQDGYADRTIEGQAEKRRMDQAKADNARRPKATAPHMKPAKGSTVDLEKKMPTTQAPAQPVTVTGISGKTVTFADPSGAVITLSRGEVRTLKAFEQRMAAKVPVMIRVAEDCKTTRQQAADLALRAQRLAEQAKHVDGGARLVAKLNRLAEQAALLKTKTSDMEKAAVRGAEAVRVVVSNANTRHGGIYRAVIDSPLTKPAERGFYTDRQGS
jgi:hypothetical protein